MSPRAPKIKVGRRIATIALLGALGVALLIAVPALRPVVREIRHMSPLAIVAAVGLELASCLSFVAIFRLFFDRIPSPEARSLAWTEMSSGALLPGGGVGGLAIGGWLMSLTGARTDWIIRRSSGLFFLTTAVNSAAVIGSSALLLVGGGAHNHDLRVWLPLLLAVPATAIIASLPWTVGRRRRSGRAWLAGIVDGIADAWRTAATPDWRLLGALGYLFFDIAVLWTTFSAVGHAPSAPALILGYTVGYLANALPVPGGVGVLDAGLAGALLIYGASPAHAVAAVLVYHAIAFWVPSLGGLLAYAWLRPRLLKNVTKPDTAPLAHTQIATLKGDTDDSTRSADHTYQGRLGRVADQRPRTRAVSRDRRQTARPPLPRAFHRPMTQERNVPARGS
jgi:uncharacterized membrane protein YbhN (UPF0104 family)